MPTELNLTSEARGPLRVYPIVAAREFGIDAFVTDRFGGTSEASYASLNLGDHVGDDPERVRENRQLVAEAIGVSLEALVIVRQVHGSEVVDSNTVGPETRADALFASASQCALAILVADCLPLLLFDEASSDFALVHAGWRGLRGGVIASAVAHFANSRSLHVFIGPSISPESYQVGPEVAEHFIHIDDAVVGDVADRSRLDLRRVALEQLRVLGVDPNRVAMSTQTTDGGGTFFSDRGERPCGRFALVARRAS